MQGEVLVPGASNMVATAEDCCQACWMYSGQPGRGNSTGAGQHALLPTVPSATQGEPPCISYPYPSAGNQPLAEHSDRAEAVSIMSAQPWCTGSLTLCAGGTGNAMAGLGMAAGAGTGRRECNAWSFCTSPIGCSSSGNSTLVQRVSVLLALA